MFGLDYCFFCKRNEKNFFCKICEKKLIPVNSPNYIDNIPVFSSFYYNYLTKKMLMELKYNKNFIIGKVMAKYMVKTLKDQFKEHLKSHILIPIPISNSRLQERTYNQALILCKYIQTLIGGDIYDSVLEKDKSESQKNKNFHDRKIVSFISKSFLPSNKLIIIVDDLVASGSTILNASKIIFENNKVKNLIVISFVKT